MEIIYGDWSQKILYLSSITIQYYELLVEVASWDHVDVQNDRFKKPYTVLFCDIGIYFTNVDF